jgi:hypothetical protein
MQPNDSLPAAVQRLQESLSPYIKQRRETTEIRRVLASHLNSGLHLVEPNTLSTVPQPLSLVGSSLGFGPAPYGIKGIHKEYLRHARANVKARREYAQIGKERQEDSTREEPGADAQSSLELFLELVRQQHKHDILSINQSYIDTLAKWPAASIQHLDPKVVLKDVGSLPQVPSEVLQIPGMQQDTGGADLRVLVDNLEKSVLRAKLLLKREQKLLSKFRTDNNMEKHDHASRLQALGTARNELINWIETELSQAGDTTADSDESHRASEGLGQEYINSQLASINRQYVQYVNSRRSLVTAVSDNLVTKVAGTVEENDEKLSAIEDLTASNCTSQITLPYLESLLALSNQQKALAQQKSYLTISLAKQLKEASQGLDRLADESHLLPAYPVPIQPLPRRGLDVTGSFASDISTYEKPDFARHARAWAYSSESAATHTKATILDKLEGGSSSIDNSRHIFLELRHLLGEDAEDPDMGKTAPGNMAERTDIWATIEGSLGTIKQDDEEPF